MIRRNHQTGQLSMDPLRRGPIPYWCEDASGGRKAINAKAETVATLPTFREPYRSGGAFSLWMRSLNGKPSKVRKPSSPTQSR